MIHRFPSFDILLKHTCRTFRSSSEIFLSEILYERLEFIEEVCILSSVASKHPINNLSQFMSYPVIEVVTNDEPQDFTFQGRQKNERVHLHRNGPVQSVVSTVIRSTLVWTQFISVKDMARGCGLKESAHNQV